MEQPSMQTPSREVSQTDYERIATAIRFIEGHYKTQPTLEEIARQIELSPSHFQRLFTTWAGTSPKKFLQYITLEHAKKMLVQGHDSLLETSHNSARSSPSRLHDLFMTIEGMTPGEYKNGGEHLVIQYRFADTPFGRVLIASTPKGICSLAFADDEKTALQEVQVRFPNASIKEATNRLQEQALAFFTQDWSKRSPLTFHLKGTPFQLKVWAALLRIPLGQLSTYGTLAEHIHHPHAYRAVGTAVGQNPVSFLIPCHRVIQSTEVFGNYHWGKTRKTAMIGWEAARIDDGLQDY